MSGYLSRVFGALPGSVYAIAEGRQDQEMAEKSTGKPLWRRGASRGSVQLWGDKLELRIRYSPRLFAAVKAIPGIHYEKSRKVWIAPLAAWHLLRSSRELSPKVLRYRIDEGALKELLKQVESQRAEALQRYEENPFAVAEDDIALVAPAVTVRESDREGGARLCCGPEVKLPKRLRELLFVIPQTSPVEFLIPVEKLGEVVKQLRDERLSFAVEKEYGERLARSSELRRRIVEGIETFSLAELLSSELRPCVGTLGGGGTRFRVYGIPAECMKILMGGEGAGLATRSKLQQLTVQELIRVLGRAWMMGIRVWLTGDVRIHLNAVEKSLPTPLPAVVPSGWCYLRRPELFLDLDPEKRPLVVARRDLWKELCTLAWGKTRAPGAPAPAGYISKVLRAAELPLVVQNLTEFGARHGITVSRSEEADALLHAASLRATRRQEARALRGLRDVALSVRNQELARKLFPHQRVAVKWLLENSCGILGDDMGLGKTLSVLAAFEELVGRGESDFLLVVCPNSLVRNWLREARQWVPALTFTQVPQEKGARKEFLRVLLRSKGQGLSGLVLNYESARLPEVLAGLLELCSSRVVALCLDESQRVKNPKSKTFESVNSLAGQCQRRVLLSGTPTPKDITDIWAQMMILDRGDRLGSNFYRWLGTVAELGNKWSEVAVKKFIPEGVEETIGLVHEVMLRRKKEEVISLPEKLFAVRDVELTGEQLERYEEVREQLLVRVSSLSGEVFAKEIQSVLEEYLRAVQIASNPRLVDPLWKGEPAKFLEADEIVQEVVEQNGGKLVIWTNFLLNVQELVARYARWGALAFSGEVSPAERAVTVEAFQSRAASTPQILVAVPAAGGVGITLTAAQTALYIDKTWNAEHWLQSIDRIHRIGQEGTVSIVSLHGSPIDELVSWNLRRKERQQANLMGDLPRSGYEDAGNWPSREQLLSAIAAATVVVGA